MQIHRSQSQDEFDKKVEWFKENWMVEKTHHKPQNLLHERNSEYKMKEEIPGKNN